MTPKRIRSLNVSVGLMTALSLGVASLAGCASFDPNPAAKGQAPVTPTSSTAPAATTPATGATTPTTPTAPAALTNLAGLAEVDGKPLANAQITVVNAFTNKPVAGLVAAGAGNLVAAGAGNMVSAGAGNYGLTQAGTLTTDAKGNFDLNIPELKDSDMVRIIVKHADGAMLSAIVGGTAETAKYGIQQITKRKQFRATVNVKSTLSANYMQGPLAVLGRMSEKDRAKAIDGFVEGVEKIENAFDGLASNDGWGGWATFLGGIQEAQAAVGGPTDFSNVESAYGGFLSFQTMDSVLKQAGIVSGDSLNVNGIIAEALKQSLEVATSGDGLSNDTTVTIDSSKFPQDLNVNLDGLESGTITFTDPETGEEQEIVIEIFEEELQAPDDVVTNQEFVPQVDLEYYENDATSPLKMIVKQDGGKLEAKTITAKIPLSLIKAKSWGATTLLNDKAATAVTGAWATYSTASNHEVKLNGTTVIDGVTVYTGYWKDGNAKSIATIKLREIPGYVQLDIESAKANDAVTTQGGTVSLEALKSVIELDVAKLKIQTIDEPPVEITITSRDGSDTNTTADGTVSYLRTIFVK